MVVIANRRIPIDKRLFVSLTYVYGIGNTSAIKIAQKAEVENKKVSQLTEDEISRVVRETENYVLEDKLREEVYKKKTRRFVWELIKEEDWKKACQCTDNLLVTTLVLSRTLEKVEVRIKKRLKQKERRTVQGLPRLRKELVRKKNNI